ncbi:MAG: AraC family transcriptional regulator, partial [Bacteroidales bacterium]
MRTIKLDTVATYNNLYGLETLHPLVTVVNLNQATSMINHITMEYGLYALYLKNGVNCQLK